MDHHHRALAPRQRHDVEHLAVVEPQQVVGHVDLERGVAVLDQRRQFLAQHLLGRVGDDQVEGIVDDRLGPAAAWYSSTTWRSDWPRCCAANGITVVVPPNAAGDRGAVEIVGAHDAGRGLLLDMAMAVDRAGQHELAAWRRSRAPRRQARGRARRRRRP